MARKLTWGRHRFWSKSLFDLNKCTIGIMPYIIILFKGVWWHTLDSYWRLWWKWKFASYTNKIVSYFLRLTFIFLGKGKVEKSIRGHDYVHLIKVYIWYSQSSTPKRPFVVTSEVARNLIHTLTKSTWKVMFKDMAPPFRGPKSS